LIATLGLLFTPSVASAAWTVSPTPNVAGADGTVLNAVDCSSANSCMAVGSAVTLPETRAPFHWATVAERWDGASWRIVPTPNPPAATDSELNGVSCPRRNVCFAVGFERTDTLPPDFPGGPPAPLIELWNGRSWSIQQSPDVARGSLEAVSCSGLFACTAVGGVTDQGSYHPLAERWDATGWHLQSTPTPANSQSNLFSAVSCPLRRTCTAVGQSITSLTSPPFTSVASPLVERWFGRVNAWGLQAAPKPDGGGDAGFTGVSCPDGRVCFAVGSSQDQTTHSLTTLAERRAGSSWSVMPTPNPGPYLSPFGLIFDAQLSSVSCPARRACHALGDGLDSAADSVVFDERFDGASWHLESIPVGSALSDVSCRSRIFCVAVGKTAINLFTGTTLAVKWTP
jgi:hypothetical protein